MAIITVFIVFFCFCGSFGANNTFFTQRCCSIGASLGTDGRDCRRNMAAVPGVSDADQKLCSSILQFCCDRERLLLDCKLGVVFAKTYHHCMLDNTTNGCSGQAETCCTACLVADSLSKSKLECKVPGSSDTTLTQVFQNCCGRSSIEENENEKETKNYVDEPIQNLCEMLPGQLCAHICVPTANSYYCRCQEGFILMEDQKTCQPEKGKQKTALPSSAFVPNPEKPVPLKKPSPQISPMVWNKAKCEEENSCEQECVNSPLGHICACRPGYELHQDRIHCNDVNECLDNIHVCDPSLEICINEVGSYKCEARPALSTSSGITPPSSEKTSSTPIDISSSTERLSGNCLDGYEKAQGSCVDVDECDTSTQPEVCEPNEQCINTQGSYECRCLSGFHRAHKNGRCEDINECQLNSHQCMPETRCDNTVGSYICHRIAGCGTGYTLNANTGLCEDDDECALRTDNCHYSGLQCRNTNGSFRCERKRCQPGDVNCHTSNPCPRGYEENPLTRQCIDIDECQRKIDSCNPSTELCVNRRGTFECRKFQTCSRGYEATQRGCVDVDECARNSHDCEPFSTCRNYAGGYVCDCIAGYEKYGARCVDIDECSRYGCSRFAECQNTPGSYRCYCNRGFRQADENNCVDEDECETTPGLCHHNCVNTYGSYYCTCKEGFHINDDNRTCEDIDECARTREGKLCHGECINVPGSYSCSCPEGYKIIGDGKICKDIDECARKPCQGPDEVCLNMGGSYACNSIACPPDYKKDLTQANRCHRSSCVNEGQKCLQTFETFSYNFISFVSMLPIPPIGQIDLFVLKGPLMPNLEAIFDMEFKNVTAPPHITPANRDYFLLRRPSRDQVVLVLRRPIPGPQKIQIEISANIFRQGIHMGRAVSKLLIYVSQYEY